MRMPIGIAPSMFRTYGGRRRRTRTRLTRGRGGNSDVSLSMRVKPQSRVQRLKSFLQRHKIISKGLALIPHRYASKASIIADQFGYGRRRRTRRLVGGKRRSPYARRTATAMRRRIVTRRRVVGGRRRTTRRRRIRGRGDEPDVAPLIHRVHARAGYPDAAVPKAWYRSLGGIHGKVKSERLLSRGLSRIGMKRASRVASSLGYGKRKRTIRRRLRGGDFLGIGNWVRKAANTVNNAVIRPATRFVKDNHVISTALSFIPHPAARAAALGARLGGLGRSRGIRF